MPSICRVLMIFLLGSVYGCATRPLSTPAGVAPEGVYGFSGIARLKKPAWREERTSCRTFSETTNTCIAWNTVTVEYDRWVEAQVRVEPRGD